MNQRFRYFGQFVHFLLNKSWNTLLLCVFKWDACLKRKNIIAAPVLRTKGGSVFISEGSIKETLKSFIFIPLL